MAQAALQCLKCTGTDAATENATDKDVALLSADVHSLDTGSYPVRAPSAGQGYSYSYECALRWKLSTAPDNYIENVAWWGPPYQPDHEANPPDKIIIFVGSTATPATPVATQSTIATTRQDTNHYSAGTALVFHPGQLIDVNDETNYLYIQAQLAEGVQQGNAPLIVGDMSWDEA